MIPQFTLARMTARLSLGRARVIGYVVLTALPAVGLLLAETGPGTDLLEALLGIVMGLYFLLAVPVITLIVSAASFGDERRDETLSFVVLRPMSRASIAAAKLGAALGVAGILNIAGAVALAVVYGGRTGDWGYLVPLVVGGFIATAIYVAIFVPLGFIFERAVFIGLAFLLIWEAGVVAALAGLGTTSPGRIGFSAVIGLAPDAALREIAGDFQQFALGTMLPGAGGAFAKAVVVFALALLLLTWFLRQRDLV